MSTFRQDQLITWTLKAITEHSNQIAAQLGIKQTKRFATKTVAVKKALANQEKLAEINDLYAEENKAVPAKVEIAQSEEDPSTSTQNLNRRPKEGTITGRIWEIADNFKNRKEVLFQAALEGINLSTASRQFHLWSHRS